ncbi:MAG: DEAD/DEAH box helicase, partial [Planctomycetota bacterium]
MPASDLSQPLTELPQIGAQRGSRFASLGLRTIRDVLFFFPRDFEFPPPQVRIDELVDGQTASILGTISDAELVSRRPGRSVFGALVENESGAIRILFFNQPFRAEQLKRGTIVRISGSVKLNGLRFEMTHPKVQIEQDHPQASDDADDQPTAGSRIAPIYPLTEGVKQFELQRLTADVTRLYAKELDEVMPVTLRTDAMTRLMQAEVFDELDASELPSQLPTIDTALSMLHDPQTNSHVQLGRIRFVFQELLAMQLALAMRRRSLTTALRAPPLECSALIRQRIVRRFPFALTSDQERVIDAIAGDMRRQFPMNRLLQGDVGSGKTVVAAFAMLLAVANGYQATMMAPTEVLARQHFQTLSDLLQDSRVRVGLLCGSLTTAERRETLQRSADGELDLIVGTQALLFDVAFKRLGVCVIDEQH